MAAKSMKVAKSGFAEQRVVIRELEQRCGAGNLLNLDADRLHIDEFTKYYTEGNKVLLRRNVNDVAHSAVYWAGQYVNRIPSARATAQQAFEVLAEIDKRAKWLRTDDHRRELFPVGLETSTDVSPYLICDDIVGLLARLHDRYELLRKNYTVMEPLHSGKSKILVQEFVRGMLGFHERQTGKPAPLQKASRFVDLMQAAWVDLRFPKLADGTLGNMAERPPHLTAQKAERKRQKRER
ncbi:hypothetical protein IVB02_39195 [Bradyrhizobium sp. 166]|uniref:hypothetical protein n=1 Tax=Bradyrhizobium sp. 166 TaxID=2782638 RepID=UPI001FFAC2DB|nr:hypothetical protein [Bradyrhizobium sp. 166]MCK1607242.1 hypothetical protein [Bradyrhizobium sp. 166]